jgi:hypothetical protein
VSNKEGAADAAEELLDYEPSDEEQVAAPAVKRSRPEFGSASTCARCKRTRARNLDLTARDASQLAELATLRTEKATLQATVTALQQQQDYTKTLALILKAVERNGGLPVPAATAATAAVLPAAAAVLRATLPRIPVIS